MLDGDFVSADDSGALKVGRNESLVLFRLPKNVRRLHISLFDCVST